MDSKKGISKKIIIRIKKLKNKGWQINNKKSDSKKSKSKKIKSKRSGISNLRIKQIP